MRKGIWLFSLLLVPVSALATTFANRPLGAVTQEATYIVRGIAGSSYAAREDADTGRIYTYTNFTVTDVIKGSLQDSQILLRQPGGEMDGVELRVPGVASFSQGEDVVVLLGTKNDDAKSYDVPGLATGKYIVSNDNGEIFLLNSLGGGAVYDPGKNPDTLSYNSRIPLDVFRKVAQGAKLPESTQTQYGQSSQPPPKGAVEADDDDVHPHLPLKASPKENKQQISEKESMPSPWVLISFLILLVAVAAGIWKLF